MKKTSPRRIVTLISLTTATIQLIVLAVYFWIEWQKHWELIFISSLSTFLIIYALTNYLLDKFFIDTINPIYKIIRSVKINPNQIEDDIDTLEFSRNLELEVDQWAKEKLQQISRLRQMEKYRKEFLGNISHELKTPIFTMQGYVSTLIEGGINDPKINKKYLLRTEKSIDRMISIVEDLITISKLESSDLILEKETFNIVQLVFELVDMQEMRAAKKNIQFKVNKTKQEIVNVNADKKLIYQVLLNLIVNSISYGREDGVTEINIYDMDVQIMVDVTDNGIGIPKQDLTRLFERFYRVDKSRSKEYGGTGLGLSICKHIMEAHLQTITVSSELGQGSSFAFTLEKV
jgi:two-component system phosphate regulon sensor histidine kinase PhoR